MSPAGKGADRARRLKEELVDNHAARVAGQGPERQEDKQGDDHCPRPIGDFGKVDREPSGQQDDLRATR